MKKNAIQKKQVSKEYELRLFISGNDPLSALAKKNITELCDSHLNENHHLEIIDILEQPELALENQVIVISMLLIEKPEPGATIVGSMRDQEKILSVLQCLI